MLDTVWSLLQRQDKFSLVSPFPLQAALRGHSPSPFPPVVGVLRVGLFFPGKTNERLPPLAALPPPHNTIVPHYRGEARRPPDPTVRFARLERMPLSLPFSPSRSEGGDVLEDSTPRHTTFCKQKKKRRRRCSQEEKAKAPHLQPPMPLVGSTVVKMLPWLPTNP